MCDVLETNRLGGRFQDTFEVVVVTHRRVPLRREYEGFRPAVAAPGFPFSEKRLDSGWQVHVAIAARRLRVVQTRLAECFVNPQLVGIIRVPVVPTEREQFPGPQSTRVEDPEDQLVPALPLMTEVEQESADLLIPPS